MLGNLAVFLVLVLHASSAPVLTAYPSVLKSSPSNVTLSWSGLDTSHSDTYCFGLYVQEEGLIHLATVNGIASASGSLNVSVLNLRMPFYFKICRGNTCSPAAAIVSSNTVQFVSLNEPQHPRIAATNTIGSLVFSFTTSESFSPPQVTLGTSSGVYPLQFSGESSAPYTISDMCFSPANESSLFFSPGFQNTITLKGLNPGGLYFYRFGGTSAKGETLWSDEHTLRVPPSPGTSQSVSSIVFGDMGVGIPYDTVTGR